jgi:YidC/Oxa1 family membrane protein insertase
MNQTRVFLIFAWMAVAVLLWMEWNRDKSAPVATPATTSQSLPSAGSQVPSALPTSAVPQAGVEGAAPAAAVQAAAPVVARSVRIVTDVLDLDVDGGTVSRASLLHYPQTKDAGAPPVELFNAQGAHPYTAVTAWGSEQGSTVPDAAAFRLDGEQTSFNLADGANELVVPFVWTGGNGVTIHRSYTFTRGSYAVQVRDEVRNDGAAPWQGYVYRRLDRMPAEMKRGMTNPDSFSFNGATWYNGSYERRAFDKDYLDDGNLNEVVQGGWLAMLQHHFFSAWIPQADQTALYLLGNNAGQYSIEARGPGFALAPGQNVSTTARLWVGPKLVDQIAAQDVKGLDRVVDYSRFNVMAIIGQGLFWVLNAVHGLVQNWGWAIVGLVVLLRLVMFPLSAKQFSSGAKMRAVQPRIAQLKERYGDDRQKFQVAMMELYKKEKINPLGGCLPLLIQMPIFFALYWVLVESVELRQAPWFAWIQDLTARDPFFILPIINVAVMWMTQKLTPMNGMDPMQAKIMQFMPLIFGVMMAFMPAGLVLYWVVNGGLGLLQQWMMIRKHGTPSSTVVATK